MPAAKPAMAMTQTAMEQGVLKKVNKATGKVSIAHEAQHGGMPAMTMVYNVKNLATLDKVQTGQKVRFATDPADGASLVHLEPMK
jgi:Cu/Ag efflux protein CusF